jgi:hypothetical protein
MLFPSLGLTVAGELDAYLRGGEKVLNPPKNVLGILLWA